VLVAILLLPWAAAAPAGAEEGRPPTVVVAGEGVASAPPDRAVVSVGVTAQAPTAAAAREDVARRMEAIVARLRKMGVAERALQTTHVTIGQHYGKQGAIEGFDASYGLAVTLTDLDRVGAVIDGAVEAGANSIGGPRYAVEDDAALRDEALAKAVEQAMRKARAIAAAAGGSLGDVVAIREQGTHRIEPRPYGRAVGMMRAAEAATPMPVETGEIDVRAGVEIEIRFRKK
jgi:uncharacterized protein YggE